MTTFRGKMIAKIAALGAATMGLSACYYDGSVGLGYYDDGYSYYECDPYSPFDNYYDCDNRYGFNNIGYGGGWYDNYWYPGYGFFIFDSFGRRYDMHDRYRRYWGGRRHEWYRENHRRRGHHGGGNGHGDRRGDHRGYRGVDGQIGWPEQHGGRVDDNHGRRRGDRDRDHAHDGSNPAVGEGWRGNDRRRERRGDGRGERRRGWDQNQGNAAQVPPPVASPQGETSRRGGGGEGRGWRRGGGEGTAPAPRVRDGNRGNWQAPPAAPQQQNSAAAPTSQPRAARPERAPRMDGRRQQAPASDGRGMEEN